MLRFVLRWLQKCDTYFPNGDLKLIYALKKANNHLTTISTDQDDSHEIEYQVSS